MPISLGFFFPIPMCVGFFFLLLFYYSRFAGNFTVFFFFAQFIFHAVHKLCERKYRLKEEVKADTGGWKELGSEEDKFHIRVMD